MRYEDFLLTAVLKLQFAHPQMCTYDIPFVVVSCSLIKIDEVVTMRPQQRMIRQRLNTPVGRSISSTRHSTGMYFTEVDVASKGAGEFKYV